MERCCFCCLFWCRFAVVVVESPKKKQLSRLDKTKALTISVAWRNFEHISAPPSNKIFFSSLFLCLFLSSELNEFSTTENRARESCFLPNSTSQPTSFLHSIFKLELTLYSAVSLFVSSPFLSLFLSSSLQTLELTLSSSQFRFFVEPSSPRPGENREKT